MIKCFEKSFNTPGLLNRFVNVVVYYGLSLSTSLLAGDRYLNFFLSGLVEVPAYAVTLISVQKYVRSRTKTVLEKEKEKQFCLLFLCMSSCHSAALFFISTDLEGSYRCSYFTL